MADKDFKVKNGIDVVGNANIAGNLNAAKYQTYAPSSPVTGQVWVDSDGSTGVLNQNDYLLKADFELVSIPVGGVTQYAGNTSPSVNYAICDGTAVNRTTYATLFARIGTTYGVGNGSTTFNLPNLKGKVPVGLDSTQTEFDTLGETGGAKTHTLTIAQIPSHLHIVDPPSANFTSGNNSVDHTHTGNSGNVAGGLTLYPSGSLYEILMGTAAGANRLFYSRNGDANNGVQVMSPGINAINADHTHNFTSNGQSVNHTHSTTVNIAAFNSATTGSGGAHNNLQPYIVMNYLIRIL